MTTVASSRSSLTFADGVDGQRHDMIDSEVRRSVGGTLEAGAPVAVLATPGGARGR